MFLWRKEVAPQWWRLSRVRRACRKIHWRAAGRRSTVIVLICSLCAFVCIMWPAALPRWMTWRPAAGRRLCLLPLDTLSVFHPWSFPEAVYQSAPQACSQCYVQKKKINGWISDVVSDKHKDDNTCHFVCLTFWRSLCTPARLWPAATRRSCPESEAIRLCGWLAVEESREVKRSWWPSREGGRVEEHTGESAATPLLLIVSRILCGTLPSSPSWLRTSHHCLDFWITCRAKKQKGLTSAILKRKWHI